MLDEFKACIFGERGGNFTRGYALLICNVQEIKTSAQSHILRVKMRQYAKQVLS